ncbi:MAG: glycosyltransferase [Coriobacteriia bacterium]|nr:glycosyltransferase [Coriobacteriia bacterium]
MALLDARQETSLKTTSDSWGSCGGAVRRISVIICAYSFERWVALCDAVRSARNQTRIPEEIIVVIDHNREMLARAVLEFSDAVVIENAGCPGLSDARNSGVAAATSEVIAFLDDDAVADHDWLENLIRAYDDDRVLAVGGKIDPIWETTQPRWMPEEFYWVFGCSYVGMPQDRSPVRNIIGANMSFRRDVLLETGGFSAELGRTADQPLGCEETEVCIRAQRLRPDGLILLDPAARVGHRVPDTRSRWSYFWARCYGEGISKARLARALGQQDGLSSERRQVLRVLPAGVVRNLGAALTGKDIWGFARAFAIVGGLAVTAAGYVTGTLKPTSQSSGKALSARSLIDTTPASSDAQPKRPRVLMVTPRYLPLTGGVENHVDQVARRLAPNVDLTILTTDRTQRLPKEESIDGVRVLRVPAWPRNRDYYFAPAIWRIIRKGGWDVVHVQSYHTAVAPLAMLAAWRTGTPYVLTFHGGGHSSGLRTALRGVQWSVLRPLLARARKLIAVAQFEAEFFAQRLGIPSERFVVIPNGSDLPHPNEPRGVNRGRRTIVSIGRLERYKGHQRIIEALPQILLAEPDTDLLILGSGPYQNELEQLAERLGVAGRVKIESIPAADRQAMADTLASSSLVVLLSQFETHPLAIVEAVSLGRPALVTDTSGLRELAARGLARSIPLDSDAAAVALTVIEELRNPRSVPSMTLPSWDECAAGVLSTYGEVLAPGRMVDSSTDSEARPQRPRPAVNWWRLGLAVVSVSAGMLTVAVADNAARNGATGVTPLYWLGLLLVFAPAALLLLRRRIPRAEALSILVLTGLVLYFVNVFQSPTLFVGYDEFMHFRTLDDIVQTGHLFTQNPLLPISPYYPGLEIVTHAVMTLTGLSAFSAGIMTIGVARLLTVIALYLLLERVAGSTWLAGLGTLVYMTSSSFLFFDTQYSYESLALPLAILCLFVVHRAQQEERGLRAGLHVFAALLVLVVIVTHHVTSYVLIGALVAWAVLVRVFRSRTSEKTPGGVWVPVLGVIAAVAWFDGVATMTVNYLAPHLVGAAQEIWRIMTGEATSRRLFESSSGQTSSLTERITGLTAVALIVASMPLGFLYLRRHIRRDVLPALLIAASVVYPAALLLRFTATGWQVGSRALAFVYVGLALVVGAGVASIRTQKRYRVPAPLLAILLLLVMAGGVIAGSSPYSRMPRPYAPGASDSSVSAEGLAAAAWARTELGPGHRIAADSTNTSLLGSYGRQWMITTTEGASVSALFLTPQFGDYQRRMIRKADIQYAVIDRRIAGASAPQGFFYEKWEKEVVDYGPVISAATLDQFDNLTETSRVFDSGNIQMYDLTRLAK